MEEGPSTEHAVTEPVSTRRRDANERSPKECDPNDPQQVPDDHGFRCNWHVERLVRAPGPHQQSCNLGQRVATVCVDDLPARPDHEVQYDGAKCRVDPNLVA